MIFGFGQIGFAIGVAQFPLAEMVGKAERHVAADAGEHVEQQPEALGRTRYLVEHHAGAVLGAQDRLRHQPDVLLPGCALEVLHLAEPLGMREPLAQVVIIDVGGDVAPGGHFLFSPVVGSLYPASPPCHTRAASLLQGPVTTGRLTTDVQGFARVHRRGREARRAAARHGCRSAYRAWRHHRGRGRDAGMPGAAVRPHQGLSGGLPHLHQRHHQSAARGAGARARSGAASSRRTQGLDGEAPDPHAPQAGDGEGRGVPGEQRQRRRGRPAQAAGAGVAHQGRRALHRLGLDRDHARSRQRLDQRLDLSRAGAHQEQGHRAVRPSRPPRRDHRPEILGCRQAVPARDRQRHGPGAVHRRVRISRRGAVGIRVRRRDQGSRRSR